MFFKLKSFLTDPHAVEKMSGDYVYNRLMKMGAYIRETQRRSLRTTKRDTHSKPGQQPRVHDFKGATSPLKATIAFAVDDATQTLFVGPKKFAPDTNAPAIQEFGGSTKRHKNPRRREMKIGMGGAIRIVERGNLIGPKQRRKRHAAGETTKKVYPGGPTVAFIKIQTPAQARLANEINAEIYGPEFISGGTVAARPSARPALLENVGKFPEIFAA